MSTDSNEFLNASEISSRYKKNIFVPWTSQHNANPNFFTEQSGVYLTLASGKKLIDLKSQAFFANLGHAHKGMMKEIANACSTINILSSDNVCIKRLALAEKLLALSPQQEMKKVFYTLGGAEANENAIKMARMFTKKFKIITRYRSYHGATLATLGVSGDYRRIGCESYMPGIIRFPDPYERGSGQKIDTVKLLEEIIQIEGPETIAAIMLEGITGANGVFIPPNDYWPNIRKLCDKYNIVLIADEVFSGFFRAGKWFAIDNFNTRADIITLSKGITAGYAPLGALLVNERIAHYFDNETVWCGLTQYGPYLSCAAALAAINFYEEENVEKNVHERSRELDEFLLNLKEKCPLIAETRSIGLLAAIDFKKDINNFDALVPYRANQEELKPTILLQKLLIENGIYAAMRFSTLLISPPLTITQQELKLAFDGIEKSVLQFLKMTKLF